MDQMAKAAAHLLSKRLSSLQEELEEKLNRSQTSVMVEDLRQLNESIRQLKDRLDKLK